MATGNDDFLRKLLETFRVEAGEHLEAMSSRLLLLERATGGERGEALEQIFREAHSLKGAARAVNFLDIETACHAIESLFGDWMRNRIVASPALFDVIHEALDFIARLLASGVTTTRHPALPVLIGKLEQISKSVASAQVESSGPAPPVAASPAGGAGAATVRLSTAKLDSIMREMEELLAPRLAAAQRVIDLRELHGSVRESRKKRQPAQTARHTLERSAARNTTPDGALVPVRELSTLLEHVEAEDLFLRGIEARIATIERATESLYHALTSSVDRLLRDVKETQMQPFSSLLEGSPRLVRDLARYEGKQVELVIHGGDIEIDRRILEQMKAPLQHLLRNAIDHGIEPPAVRQERGKHVRGQVSIDVAHKHGRIEIVTADDGAGIDVETVRAAAARLGIASAARIEELSDPEAMSLIFESGFSTTPTITDISGRGLGLAIVREKVERLGGTIAIESRPATGTSIRLTLPLTLATFRGLLVHTAERRFIIPAAGVGRVTRVAAAGIRTVENRETISVEGRSIPLVSLADILELAPAAEKAAELAQVVILGTGATRIAFRVSAVVAEQEVLVKGLGPQLPRVRNIVGATVLGTGEVVPVLSVSDLMKSAVTAVPPAAPAEATAVYERQRNILVVEDSITSRMLLKNILEAAGYDVAVAVDGIDAFTRLRTESFDLVVSDVEMPRMNGFDLTSRIRSEPALARLPVILVTALESRADRERGVDAGANAYLVKSSFDQSNLLDVIRRLI
jgi:two-component system chemotaxis sensor kinase CheA